MMIVSLTTWLGSWVYNVTYILNLPLMVGTLHILWLDLRLDYPSTLYLDWLVFLGWPINFKIYFLIFLCLPHITNILLKSKSLLKYLGHWHTSLFFKNWQPSHIGCSCSHFWFILVVSWITGTPIYLSHSLSYQKGNRATQKGEDCVALEIV